MIRQRHVQDHRENKGEQNECRQEARMASDVSSTKFFR